MKKEHVCNCKDYNKPKVKVINKSRNKLPMYKTNGAACMDVEANIETSIVLDPGKRVLIPTGLFMQLPANMEVKVRPRSGMALKEGITVLNSPGCIDEDYRGEIGIILINHGDKSYTIQPSERVAQISFEYVEKIEWEEVDSLDETERGTGGFGHTGKANEVATEPEVKEECDCSDCCEK